MPPRYTLPHIDISAYADAQEYSGHSSFDGGAVRIRAEHGRRLQNELTAALNASQEARPTDQRLEQPPGSLVEVSLRRGTDPEKLNMKTEGVRAGAAKTTAANDRVIALYVPDDARIALEAILSDYLEKDTDGGNPRYKDRVEAIEAFRVARIETLWTDPRSIPEDPQTQTWWAVWCHRDKEVRIDDVCARLGVRAATDDRRLYFHEVAVVPVLTTRATIELMMFAAADAIAELRLANDSPVFFTDEVRGDQQKWVDGLAERITWPGGDAPVVCVLDTGVNRGNALLEPALAEGDRFALKDEWGPDDHDDQGHGTSMAGLALHGDLTAALSDTAERELKHRLESVKLLPPDGFDANEPQSYGVLTQAGISLPEIEEPDRKRVFCMAITNDNVSGATASPWSAAIDQAAAGCMEGEAGEDDDSRTRRLFVVSAGNVPAVTNYAERLSQDDYPIEDPAQAWNALTIGGYTDLIDVQDEGYEDWNPLVEAGALSPHSRTSTTWTQGIAPFKPELVMEAGNRAVNNTQTEILTVGSLSLLTTGHEAATPLVSFDATSAATAQAARMAARLSAEHPELWPETIRALMVHSAEWTEPMQTSMNAAGGKRDRYLLIRRFGYGVPDFDRANASALNHLALVAQQEIQPFRLEGQRKFNECHYYPLPIPADMLERLENEVVQLKVTLSYFIDPNPGLSANVDAQRYQSYGLRFDLQRRNETMQQFKARVNASEDGGQGRAAPADGRWMLGQDSVSSGSLHCDVWTGPAIELLRRTTLCIKPVNGWWRYRASRDVCNRKTRYALIVTLKTANVDLDIYTPISTEVGVPIEVETNV
jgi:hypothetical protein